MKTYKFLELIELKKAGRKFQFYGGTCPMHSDCLTPDSRWTMNEITADWKVKFEPDVVEFELDCRQGNLISEFIHFSFLWLDQSKYDQLGNKRWHIVATEKVEGE